MVRALLHCHTDFCIDDTDQRCTAGKFYEVFKVSTKVGDPYYHIIDDKKVDLDFSEYDGYDDDYRLWFDLVLWEG
jgi:hypothetical protein